MKISVIGTRGVPNIQGGVEKHCQELYSRLSKLGVDISIFARKKYFTGFRPKQWSNINIVYLCAPKQTGLEALVHSFFASLISIFIRPDITHFHNMGAAIFIPLLKLFRIKTVFTYHSINYQHKKWGLLARFVLRVGEYVGVNFSDKVIVVSQTTKAFLEKKYKRKDLEYIPNGVEIPVQNFTSRSVLTKYDLEPKKYIFTVSRIVPEKGILDILEAYKRVSSPDHKLVIVGGFDCGSAYGDKVKKSAEEDNNVILTGFLTGDDLAGVYSYADLFVSASYNEGLPMAVLEALAYGVPVLLSNIPQHRELDLQEGRFFPVGDIPMLSHKMISLIRLGLPKEERNRQENILRTRYNWDMITARTIEIYKDIP